jgi:hypothetical protein
VGEVGDVHTVEVMGSRPVSPTPNPISAAAGLASRRVGYDGEKHRKVVRQRLPQYVEVDVEVVAYEPVAHPGRLRPRDVRMFFFRLGADLLRCLADDLDQLGQSESQHVVVVESLTRGTCSEFQGTFGGVAQMA